MRQVLYWSLISTGLLALAGCSDNTGAGKDHGLADFLSPDMYSWQLDTGYVPSKDAATPDAPTPDASSSGVKLAPFTQTFEKGTGGLTSNGKDWEWGQIKFKAGTNCGSPSSAVPPKAGQSGMGMWGTKLNDCHSPLGNEATASSGGSCTNTNYMDDSILSLKVKIPSTFVLASLSFYEWRDVNYYFDWHEIRVINSKGVHKVVKKYCDSSRTAPTAWKKVQVYLDTWIGQTITIQFHFMASKYVNYAGWYIDELSVKDE